MGARERGRVDGGEVCSGEGGYLTSPCVRRSALTNLTGWCNTHNWSWLSTTALQTLASSCYRMTLQLGPSRISKRHQCHHSNGDAHKQSHPPTRAESSSGSASIFPSACECEASVDIRASRGKGRVTHLWSCHLFASSALHHHPVADSQCDGHMPHSRSRTNGMLCQKTTTSSCHEISTRRHASVTTSQSTMASP